MNFRFWGTIKNDVYAQEIRDMDDLKDKIRAAFRKYEVNFRVLDRVMDACEDRLRQCHLSGGAKVELCRKKNCSCQG